MSDPDWELKDRRIAWESITKSLAEIQAALIQSKMVSFNSLQDALDDLHKSRGIEMSQFLSISSDEPKTTMQMPKEQDKDKSRVCERCARNGKDTKISQGVAEFSMKNYGEQLCMECQKHAKKQSG